MAKVSIILPSYNSINYIQKCIESVINQSVPDIEILCVDAESNDGTMDLLRYYEKNDHRVNVILSQKRSYGHQINLGIRKSSGEYIGIVETDDWIEPDMYAVLLNSIKDSGADYVKGKGEMFYSISENITYNARIETELDNMYDTNTKKAVVYPDQTPEIVLWDYYLWSGLYKKELLDQIILNETPGASFQDIGFLIQLFKSSKKAIYVNKVLYHYRKDNNNASSYDAKALDFLLNEYDYVNTIIQDSTSLWKVTIEKKLILQAFYRIRMMAYKGVFQDESLPSLIRLQQRINSLWCTGCLSAKDYSEYEWYNIGLFLDSPRTLFNKLDRELTPSKHAIKTILEVSSGRFCVIFGCGKKGVFLSFILRKKNTANRIVFCDNAKEKQNSIVHGIHVYSVDDVVSMNHDFLFIITGKKINEMREQLLMHGINNNSIIDFTAPEDYGMFLEI